MSPSEQALRLGRAHLLQSGYLSHLQHSPQRQPPSQTPHWPAVSQHSVTQQTALTEPASVSDETTLSASEVTRKSSTTTDPTTDGDNDSGVDSLRVAADGGPLALSIAAIAAIALACTLLITILALIVICMCFCVYDCRRKRKPYTVNEQKSKAPPINLAIANRIFV